MREQYEKGVERAEYAVKPVSIHIHCQVVACLEPGAFVGCTCNADHACTSSLSELANERAYCAGYYKRFIGLQLTNIMEALKPYKCANNMRKG